MFAIDLARRSNLAEVQFWTVRFLRSAIASEYLCTDKIDPTAVALVKELDGLPLALFTAGPYLAQVKMSFLEYLRLYKTSWLKLQMTSLQLNSYEDRSLYTTWQLSLQRIEQQNIDLLEGADLETSMKRIRRWVPHPTPRRRHRSDDAKPYYTS
jgi:hypothetical protein